MNNRGLLLGALGFAAAVAAERLVASMAADLARYDKMRKMSDQPSLGKELLATIGGVVGDFSRDRKDAATGLLGSLTSDIVRYARIRGM